MAVLYDRPVRELLAQAVMALPPTFSRNDAVEWFRDHYPSVKPATVNAHITAATVNSRSRHHYPAADQHLLFRRGDGLLERYDASRHGQWDLWGELVPGTGIHRPKDHPPAPRTTRRTAPRSAQAFEDHAREVCSAHFGCPLRSGMIEIRPGVPHQFDLVSSDGRVVGDAKYFKNIAVPAAKWSVVAEYVWLLQNLPSAVTRFMVFGQDREVPDRWLKRFRPLSDGVDFFFLPDDGGHLIPL